MDTPKNMYPRDRVEGVLVHGEQRRGGQSAGVGGEERRRPGKGFGETGDLDDESRTTQR